MERFYCAEPSWELSYTKTSGILPLLEMEEALLMNNNAKKITIIGMLCAVTYAVMAVGRIPVVLFLKYDPSDVVVTLGGLIWGPMTSCTVSSATRRSNSLSAS